MAGHADTCNVEGPSLTLCLIGRQRAALQDPRDGILCAGRQACDVGWGERQSERSMSACQKSLDKGEALFIIQRTESPWFNMLRVQAVQSPVDALILSPP